MTRPSRREIERKIDELQTGVPSEEQFEQGLTSEEKAYLDQVFAFDPEEGKSEWQRQQWDQLIEAHEGDQA